MYLDKEAYERAGLVGKPCGAKGNRGLRPRWVVDFDLRSPSMFRGKKGFDRLVYACKNVFNEPVTWLFCNAYHTGKINFLFIPTPGPRSSTDIFASVPNPDPLDAFRPTRCTASPEISDGLGVTLPPLKVSPDLLFDIEDLPEAVSETYEWLSLVRLQSPRVFSTDSVDPYLSRYRTPGEPDEQGQAKVCTVTWEGLFTPSFARQMLTDMLLHMPSQAWFSLTVACFSKGFHGDAAECTILRPPMSSGEYLLWDIKSHGE